MTELWEKLVHRVDAMTLRHRVFASLGILAIILAIFMLGFLRPQLAKQRVVRQQMEQDRTQLAALKNALDQKIAESKLDPDTVERLRLKELKDSAERMRSSMLDTRRDLVAPEQMPAMLEGILKRNAKLTLRSLKTIPPVSLRDSMQESGKAAANPPKGATPADAIYRHGVEIVVQGNYLDMLKYLSDLESMPWQVFWGKASFAVNEYPTATLTLTIYTLSMDKRWMGI